MKSCKAIISVLDVLDTVIELLIQSLPPFPLDPEISKATVSHPPIMLGALIDIVGAMAVIGDFSIRDVDCVDKYDEQLLVDWHFDLMEAILDRVNVSPGFAQIEPGDNCWIYPLIVEKSIH
jgi:hypothetical protein